MDLSKQPWWKDALVYQIYPASFLCPSDSSFPPNDSSATVGNIRGIIAKVPYIASLGFDTLWLSPVFASPQKDMGYDISDYRSIYPPYGTVDDVQELIDTLHKTTVPDGITGAGGSGQRKMRLLMDLVVNHTSDEHPWFLESKSNRTNARADWYLWRDPKMIPDPSDSSKKIKSEPNNWRSIFGGSAWHYVEERKQYYLALFLPGQPDLNWENEKMRATAYDDMKWWLDRGVDGFRIDSMNLMSKHPDLPDAKITEPDEKYQDGKEFYASGPRMHEYLREMRAKVFHAYGDTYTVGELGGVESEEGVSKYVAKARHELDTIFTGMDLDFGPTGKYTAGGEFEPHKLKDLTGKWQLAMPKFDGWNTVYLDNHDSGRSLTRYASDEPQYRVAAATMLATYLMTLSGTPFILSGQEIGMANLGKDVGNDKYIDVEGQNWYNKILKERQAKGGSNIDMSDVMKQLQLKSRDHGRLPMQWSAEPNAGFCAPDKKPWMTVNPDYTQWNVESQVGKAGSIFEYWKDLIPVRRAHRDVLVYGDFTMLLAEETGPDVIGYQRTFGTKKVVVLLSFSKQDTVFHNTHYQDWKVIIGNMQDTWVGGKDFKLRPYEAIVLSNQA